MTTDDDYRAINHANWESRVPVHAASSGYRLDRYIAEPDLLSEVVEFDRPRLGDVAGLDIVHLQCHMGNDSLSLARLGGNVTGLDFSAGALEHARVSAAGGPHVEYVEADVDDAVRVLGAERFDLVYTGVGALCWLPWVTRWAEVVAGLLKPDGELFAREGHPVLWALDDPRPDRLAVLAHPYFETDGASFSDEQTYVGDGEPVATPRRSGALAGDIHAVCAAPLNCDTGAMSDRVIVSISDGIADVRFNRPDKRNALDGEQFAAIEEVGERLKSAEGVRVVVLSGEGESFCAGLDFSMFSGMAGSEPGPADRAGSPGDLPEGRITHRGQQICWVWQELPVPVIAAVHGHALGGGFQIALGADIRIAHPDTKWSVREVHWGLVPDMTGTFVLSRLVRSDIARELTYTARMVDGREAHEIGLVTRLSDAPYDDAMALAAEIVGRSPGAVRGAKALFNRMFTDGAAEQFAEERRLIAEQIGTPNQIEAIMSNMERRAPNFVD